MKRALAISSALGLALVLVVGLGLAVFLQPFRDHLRASYGFEPPGYYDALPADTEANRAAVADLLERNAKQHAAIEKHVRSASAPQLPAGRSAPMNWGSFVAPEEEIAATYQAESLADGAEYPRRGCHLDWGWLDQELGLCRSVDQAAFAAERYARDAQAYWTLRLQPEPTPSFPAKPTSDPRHQ